MNAAFYKSARLACLAIKVQCIREVALHAHRADRNGGFILACTHLSHLEPVVVSLRVRRHIHWMARAEFYRHWWTAVALGLAGAVRVDRFGFSLPAVRRATSLAAQGRVVGIFPEGGVATGPASVLRGGPMKHGVCTIAIRARVPVIPVIILGTHALNSVPPWLPFRRGRVWSAFGEPLEPPPPSRPGRHARQLLVARLADAYCSLYQELLQAADLKDEDFP